MSTAIVELDFAHGSGGLQLEHNAWTCTCDNDWMGRYLRRWHLERHPLAPATWASCQEPASTHRRHLTDLTPVEGVVCNVAALSAGAATPTGSPAVASTLALLLLLLAGRCL